MTPRDRSNGVARLSVLALLLKERLGFKSRALSILAKVGGSCASSVDVRAIGVLWSVRRIGVCDLNVGMERGVG